MEHYITKYEENGIKYARQVMNVRCMRPRREVQRMPRQRNSVARYNISKHRYMELYHYCLQYNEWQEFLENNKDTMQSINTDEVIAFTNKKSDKTSSLAIKRHDMENKCKIIEETAKEAGGYLGKYILAAVTDEDCTFNYLEAKGIPCSRNTFYTARRKFYYLLSEKV